MQLIDGRPVYSATDLVRFLACSHLLELERAALAGLVQKPVRDDPAIDLIARRGYEHEQRYRDELVARGLRVVTVDQDGSAATVGDDLRRAAAATEQAMRAGADVVYQATFFDGTWRGHADFLLRVDEPSELGSWSYQVADTKLARHVKAGAVLQICSYVDQLSRVQGVEPRELHVVLGGSARATESFRVADFMAYFRRVKLEFERSVAAGDPAYPPLATYPDPVEHCDVCRWNLACRQRRREDDDLSRVAGITARQRRALKDRGVRTRAALAGLPLPLVPRLDGVSREALGRVREQARIQVEGDEGDPRWEFLLPLERDDGGALVRDRGFLNLPAPSPNDLFFDIEGDPFALEDGVDYLFGILEPAAQDPDLPGQPRFHEIWSRDADGAVTAAAEKAAFERVMDLLMARLDADPSLHVYHYAAYERTALARLAQRYGTREEEVDRLLRAGVLVDLYRVVRQGIRASVESYSIKRLEPLYGLEREVDLRSAGSSIVQFEAWLEGAETVDGNVGDGILREIAGYNRDDVVSNWRLRDWLEARRAELEVLVGQPLPRPAPDVDPAVDEPGERAAAVAALMEQLMAPIPSDPAAWTEDERATWLLAQLLPWHRRENKAFWWRFYELCGMPDDELVDEREPLGNIQLEADLGPSGRDGRLERYRFPPQDHALKVGREVRDPRTGGKAGRVTEIDELGGTVTLHRTARDLESGIPRSLIPWEYVPTTVLEDALFRIGTSVAECGIDRDAPYRAARELLRRRAPRLTTGPATASLRDEAESALDACVRLVLDLEESTLAIQGPPGTGKTWTGARMILALVADGRKVGVTANSHKVIGNLLEAVRRAADEAGVTVRIGQRPAQGEEPTCETARKLPTNGMAADALANGAVDVVGGTVWAWAAVELARSVDVLVVDEAGQLSLANAVAASQAAGSLVLIGDPQQLDQPTKGSHPPGAGTSALGHLLQGRPRIPPDIGIFIEETRRLHPDICGYTSEIFYASALTPHPSAEGQRLSAPGILAGTGIRWMPVEHEGRDTESPEEAAVIARLATEVLDAGARWTDHEGRERLLRPEDILVVAPYNAHVELIAGTVPPGVRVGTVDKFQGQEAPVAIYAMGTSAPELAPRGMEFLYSLNRLNVATSRARAIAAVVASPALVRVQCRTPRQMQLANALCRLVEVAREQHGGS